MSDFVTTSTKQLSSSDSKKITEKIANMVVKDYASWLYTPLNVVCGEGFSDLIHTIAPVLFNFMQEYSSCSHNVSLRGGERPTEDRPRCGFRCGNNNRHLDQ